MVQRTIRDLRDSEFPNLGQQVYADWTGGALPPASLIDMHAQTLKGNLWGNPHSHHRPSKRAMDAILATRRRILEFHRASPDEYEVIFTPNASAAILLLQHFMWEGGELVLSSTNHNTVNGLRGIARRNGAVVRYTGLNEDLTLDEEHLDRAIRFPRQTRGNRLLAIPGKSNYSGTLMDLSWVSRAQEQGMSVLLDAAALVANKRLDLSRVKPDFVPISFYKMFGFPTGVGCLLIRKDAYQLMHKKWFSGGTILLASVLRDFHIMETTNYARYEDGTVNFQMIPAVLNGLAFLDEIEPHGSERNQHAETVAHPLREALLKLEVGDGHIKVHNKPCSDTVTFSVCNGGDVVDAWEFEEFATERGVHVRTGCFCNPGENERVFGYDAAAYDGLYDDAIDAEDVTLDELKRHSGGKPIGAIRASFGYANRAEDATRFADVVGEFLETLN